MKLIYKLYRPLVAVLIMMASLSEIQAQSKITGTVIGAQEGYGIPGVTILVKGSNSGTTTDMDGNFSIEANSEDVLIFSFVGFLTVEQTVGNRTVINVELVEDISELAEVVIMGYSEKSRRELTASATTVSGKDLQNVTTSGVGSMLQGKVAGVSVTTASGAPGTDAEIRIRGVNSLTADRDPLVVVDGMIGGTYQPNDVESVTVLKDAAATALYGKLAAGGVLIVTTKSGSGEPVIEFSSSVGMREITTGNFEVMNSKELYETQKTMWGDDLVNFLKARPEDLEDLNFNWVDEAYKPGVIQNYYIAARGSNDKTNYAISLDYWDEEGTLLKTGYDRLSFRTNLGFQLKPNVHLRTNLAIVRSETNQDFWDWRYDPFLYLPWDNPYNEDGSIKYIDNTSSEVWYGRDRKNILHSAQYNYSLWKTFEISGNIFLTVDITDWLSIESRNKVSVYNSRGETFYDPRTREGKSASGSLSTSEGYSHDLISTFLIRADKSFGKHSIGGFVGVEGSEYYYEDIGGTGRNIPIGLNVMSAASEPVSVYGSNVTGTSLSYLSEATYSYNNKYFVNGVFRADASSQFGKSVRWGYFPGVSVSYIISEEDFFSGGFISFLKLRASYGEVGNDNVGDNPFPFLSYYSLSGQYNGSPAATIPLLANPLITWETSISRNVGVDMNVKERADVTLDYYNNKTVDLLLDVQLPFSTGFELQTGNVGAIRNQGVELGVTAKIIQKPDLSWTSSFNAAYNVSKNLEFANTDELQFGSENKQLARVGEEIRQWYLPKWLGVDPENGDPLWEKVLRDESGNVVGREATNNYNEAEFQTVGSVMPKVYGGWTNNLNYKGFSLSAVFSYQAGNKIYHRARQFFDNDGAYTEYNLMKLQDGWSRWEEPGDIATHPLAVRGGNQLSNAPSSRYLEDGSYIRLRNVSLGYTFSDAVCSILGVKDLNISLSGDNLYTWTKFSGLDPDVRISSAAFELPGVQDFKYPISKQYLVKLSAKF